MKVHFKSLLIEEDRPTTYMYLYTQLRLLGEFRTGTLQLGPSVAYIRPLFANLNMSSKTVQEKAIPK